jgi:hypothetical protein
MTYYFNTNVYISTLNPSQIKTGIFLVDLHVTHIFYKGLVTFSVTRKTTVK